MTIQETSAELRQELSPWAVAVGPLYSEAFLQDVFHYSLEEIDAMTTEAQCIWIKAEEGERLFPIDQFDDEGRVVRAAQQLANILSNTGVLDLYMQASWCNANKKQFAFRRPWDIIIESPDELDSTLSDTAKGAIDRMTNM